MAGVRIRIREEHRLIEDLLAEYNFYDNLEGNLHLPNSQRMWAWINTRGTEKMVKLIDSVMSGYPIPSCILNQVNVRRYEVYDGRHRIETMWKYKNNEFKWKNKLYSDLSREEKEAFDRRQIPLTIMNRATPDQLADAFIRLNSGVSLKDYDMFWAWKDTPLLQAVERLVLRNERLSKALGGENLRNRKDLANWVALVYGLATNNSGNITTSYIRITGNGGGLEVVVDDAFVTQGINALCSVLESAWMQIGAGIADKDKKPFKKVGKFIAFFLAEWMHEENKQAVITKWVKILVKYLTPGDNMPIAFTVSGAQNLNGDKIKIVLERVNECYRTGHVSDASSVDDDPDDE